MFLRMQIYDELQKYLFLFCALEWTIFIYKHQATNYFWLIVPSIDQSDSNNLVTQCPIVSLTNPTQHYLTGCSVGVFSTIGVCLIGCGKHSWLWESIWFGNCNRYMSSAKGLGGPFKLLNSICISQSYKTAISVQNHTLRVEYSL